jgi:hypothetical protein
MGALTESEIFGCMYENLNLAAQHAVDLAKLPAQGPTYSQFREEMLLVEGCCRQASAWREDTRWLQVGLVIAEALQRTGSWLRGYRVEGQMGKVFYSRDLYLMLADNLRGIARVIEGLQHNATGRVGMILPEPGKVIRTESRPVQVLGQSKTA